MTAEIAVMNKQAIALAADSAVTATGPKTPKIFNCANKIFRLSVSHPVGIMIYGNASFMGVPWETLIKEFRRELGEQSYPQLDDYSQRFIQFLGTQHELLSSETQEAFVESRVKSFFNFLQKQAQDAARLDMMKHLAGGGRMSQAGMLKLHRKYLTTQIEQLHKQSDVGPPVSMEQSEALEKQYLQAVGKLHDDMFAPLKLSKRDRQHLLMLAIRLLMVDNAHGCERDESGVIIAGFGDKDLFPKVECHCIWGVAGNQVLRRRVMGYAINDDERAGVLAFAQREMVNTFMEGVDIVYQKRVERETTTLLHRLIDATIKVDDKRDDNEKHSLREALRKTAGEMLKEYKEQLSKWRRQYQTKPIVDVTASLPKEELADMAEALVNLTSLKRRVSAALETVGGPVDVAVISKGDGFIWIKRKHYFRPELNPGFLSKYWGKVAEVDDAAEEVG